MEVEEKAQGSQMSYGQGVGKYLTAEEKWVTECNE
jgi:hypothetical protein